MAKPKLTRAWKKNRGSDDGVGSRLLAAGKSAVLTSVKIGAGRVFLHLDSGIDTATTMQRAVTFDAEILDAASAAHRQTRSLIWLWLLEQSIQECPPPDLAAGLNDGTHGPRTRPPPL